MNNLQLLGKKCKPYIIAELSGNHNQSLGRAIAIINAAHQAGVDAIKLQTYMASTLTLNCSKKDFAIEDKNSLWYGQTLYELYQQAQTPWEWHKPMFKHCKELGLACFSTPFDEAAVDYLEELNCPYYKIASFENNHLFLLKKVALTGKPILLSTGMATLSELEMAVKTIKAAGCKDLILLKCTSTYPASPSDSNILTIPHMRELFQCSVGLSDHTPGIGAAVAAVALGASVIEKHFTLCREDGGVDAAFSLEPDEMKMLVEECKRAYESLGCIKYGPTEAELDSMKFRRSIYIITDLKKGDLLTQDNIKIIRPGYGLHPQYYELVLGKNIRKDVLRGTPLSWDALF